MVKQEEIKRLIKSGFDLELISFELDIPIEQLKEFKNELERNNSKNVDRRKSSYEHSKMDKMREKYKELFYKSNKVKVEIKQPKQLSEKDIELIESTIATIEERIQEIRGLLGKEKRDAVASILSQFNKIKDYNLTMEQAERLNNLMSSEELQQMNDSMDFRIDTARRRIVTQLANVIRTKQAQTQDIEELKALRQKLTSEMARQNHLIVDTVKSEITNKILSIERKQANDWRKNSISTSIESIITDLSNGKIDMQRANAIIDEEAKKRVNNGPKTIFSLTEEQERKQILGQIKIAIRDKGDKYHLESPETAILQLHELCGEELGQSIRAVVKNVIARKDFQIAKDICQKYSGEEGSQIEKLIIALKKEIRNAEISDLVLAGINMNGTVEEETAYFELIEKGLSRGNVKLGAISLGKSEDGLRTITLADIWPINNREQKLR